MPHMGRCCHCGGPAAAGNVIRYMRFADGTVDESYYQWNLTGDDESHTFRMHAGISKYATGASTVESLINGVVTNTDYINGTNYSMMPQNWSYAASDAVGTGSHLGSQRPTTVSIELNYASWNYVPEVRGDDIYVRVDSAQLLVNNSAAGPVTTFNRLETDGLVTGEFLEEFMGQDGSCFYNWYTVLELPCTVPIGDGDVIGVEVTITATLSTPYPDTLGKTHAVTGNNYARLMHVSAARYFSSSPSFIRTNVVGGQCTYAVNGNKLLKFKPTSQTIQLTMTGGSWRPVSGNNVWKMQAGGNWGSPTNEPEGVVITQTTSDHDLGSLKTFQINWSGEKVWLSLTNPNKGTSGFYYDKVIYAPSPDGTYANPSSRGITSTSSTLWGRMNPGVFNVAGTTFVPFVGYRGNTFTMIYNDTIAASVSNAPLSIYVEKVSA